MQQLVICREVFDDLTSFSIWIWWCLSSDSRSQFTAYSQADKWFCAWRRYSAWWLLQQISSQTH